MIDLGVTGVNGKGTRSKNQGTDLRSDDFYGSVGSMSALCPPEAVRFEWVALAWLTRD